jgi:hypothetical protein
VVPKNWDQTQGINNRSIENISRVLACPKQLNKMGFNDYNTKNTIVVLSQPADILQMSQPYQNVSCHNPISQGLAQEN